MTRVSLAMKWNCIFRGPPMMMVEMVVAMGVVMAHWAGLVRMCLSLINVKGNLNMTPRGV